MADEEQVTSNTPISDGAGRWYVISSGNIAGPLAVTAILEKLEKNLYSWADFAWNRDGEAKWVRLCELEEFKSGHPKAPPVSLIGQILEKIQREDEQRRRALETNRRISRKVYRKKVLLTEKDKRRWIWFVQFGRGDHYGPLSIDEILKFAHKGIISGQVYVWREGMGEWEKIQDVPEFQDLLQQFQINPKQRSSNRVPLVATVVIRRGNEMVLGSCRDISRDGMQVLSSQPPGEIGAAVQVSINPADDSLPSVEVTGTIVRHLESGLGFGLRFSKLSDAQKSLIHKLVSSVETEPDQGDAGQQKK